STPSRAAARAGRAGGPRARGSVCLEDLSTRVSTPAQSPGRRGSHAGRAAEGLREDRRLPRRLRAFVVDLPDHVQYGDVTAEILAAGAGDRAGAGTAAGRRQRASGTASDTPTGLVSSPRRSIAA